MTVDWDKMHMRFTQNDSKVKLQGDPKLMRAIVFLRSLAKTADIEFGGVLWSMLNLGTQMSGKTLLGFNLASLNLFYLDMPMSLNHLVAYLQSRVKIMILESKTVVVQCKFAHIVMHIIKKTKLRRW